MNFEDLNLLEVGNSIRLTGVIYTDNKTDYLCYLPEEESEGLSYTQLLMNLEQWKKFIRQTDLLETEIIAQAADGKLAKIILRKSARQIDSRVSWKIFQRDKYTCQYCGKTGIPLTIDHLILWEEGGPTIEANLLTSCRKCNKQRGNTPLEEWFNSELYKKKSKNITRMMHHHNLSLVNQITTIERVYHKKSR